MTNLEQSFEQEFEKQKSELQKPNLAVIGATGAGKSSLINRVFGVKLAETGSGKPVTSGMNRYEQPNIPLIVYDTQGYEISSNEDINATTTNFEQVILPKIRKMNAGTLQEHLHLVWYCVSIATHRLSQYDLYLIELLQKEHLNLAVVFTQCDSDDIDPNNHGVTAQEFRKIIHNINPKIPCFETCATVKTILLDLEKLLTWSEQLLPNDQLRQSFVQAQKISLDAKRRTSYTVVVATAAGTAATGGLNPLPVSDSLLIVPQQIAMVIAISKIFGFDSLADIGGNLIKTQILSLAGKQTAASLLKLIPGVGQVINAAVAGTLTAGLGIALIEIFTKIYTEYLESGKMPEWSAAFSSDEFIHAIKKGMESWKQNN